MLKSKFNLVHREVEDSAETESSRSTIPKVDNNLDEEVPQGDRPRRLFKSEVSIRLSNLGKTAAGDGYTYLKATCTGMGLCNIEALASFKHLQYVDVSENNLTLDDLQVLSKIPFLLLIQADKNLLEGASLKKMKYLQVLILNYNRITSVEDVYQPELSTLEAGYNQIENISFNTKMAQIRCLDFKYNLIQELGVLDFPNLDSLYLAGNKLKSVEGIHKLVNLRVLHLRDNPIKLLDGFSENNKKLRILNLRNCKVSTLRQVKKLKVLPDLEILILRGCPYMGGTGDESVESKEEQDDDPELRVSVLAALPKLKRLNKGVFSADERLSNISLNSVCVKMDNKTLKFMDSQKGKPTLVHDGHRAEAKDLITQWLEGGGSEEAIEEEVVGEGG